MICRNVFNVFSSQGCNRVVKAEMQYKAQKEGGRQSRRTAAPLSKDYIRQCQAATRGEDEDQKGILNSQVLILELLYVKSVDVRFIECPCVSSIILQLLLLLPANCEVLPFSLVQPLSFSS